MYAGAQGPSIAICNLCVCLSVCVCVCGCVFRQGEAGIPSPPATYNLVRDFGALPNDAVSDYAAFSRALQTIPAGGVLFIPAGTFVLDK